MGFSKIPTENCKIIPVMVPHLDAILKDFELFPIGYGEPLKVLKQGMKRP